MTELLVVIICQSLIICLILWDRRIERRDFAQILAVTSGEAAAERQSLLDRIQHPRMVQTPERKTSEVELIFDPTEEGEMNLAGSIVSGDET